MSDPQLPPSNSNSNNNSNNNNNDNNNGRKHHHNNNHSPNRRSQYSGRMRTASSGSTRGAFGLFPVDASELNPEDIYERQQERRNYQRHLINDNDNAANFEDHPVSGPSGTNVDLNRKHHTNTHTHTNTHASTNQHAAQQNYQQQRHRQQQQQQKQQQQQHSYQIQQEYDYEQHEFDYQHFNSNNNNNNNNNMRHKAFHSPGKSADNMQLNQIAMDAMRGDDHNDEELGGNVHSRNNQQHPLTSGYNLTSSKYGNNMNAENNTLAPLMDNRKVNTTNINYGSSMMNTNPTSHNMEPTNPTNIVYAPQPNNNMGYSPQPNNNLQKHINTFNNNHDPYGHNTSRSESSGSYGSSQGSRYTDENDNEYEEPLTWFQYLIFHKDKPEFTSLQQLIWAVLLGIFMGIFTAMWSQMIEFCVEFTWKTVPEYLLEIGVFTDLEGRFPLPYYMVVCPAVFGGLLSYITAIIENPKVPGQNEWIESLHRVGVMDHQMFIQMILIATAGMASGLSLGPEMPLVLTAGMIGSLVAIKCKQSVLSARVMNLTAASAGIGGFFGFPMAGALFVLELPHRMGLQYFEAVSPATFASIVSVIVNRMITGDEVNGMFKYPFLSTTLPGSVFWVVIVYGIVGSFVGVVYAKGILWLKNWVHDWFHAPHDDHDHDYLKLDPHKGDDHAITYGGAHGHGHGGHYGKKQKSCCMVIQNGVQRFFGIEHEPTRAAVAGILVGIIVGLNCMLLPHNLFWGEAQLQTMIDRGMTPLPVFGYDDEPTAILTAYGYCLIDPNDQREGIKGFSTACAGIIGVTKIFVVGISLGTGVCGGHFWAPLVVACALSHFFTDLMADVSYYIGYGKELSAYPCLAVLCIMGSAHVVTFRAQLAIILVLTLSVISFTDEEKLNYANGDYSAIFPLLVVACFVPLLLTRSVVFYAKQNCRGDITAIPEVLCEPHKAGTARICRIDNLDDMGSANSSSYGENGDGLSMAGSDNLSDELSFEEDKYDKGSAANTPRTEDASINSPSADASKLTLDKVEIRAKSEGADPLNASMHSVRSIRSSSSRRSRVSSSGSRTRPNLKRVNSIGKIEDSNYQKPLLFQSREGAASTVVKKSSSRSNTPVNAGPKLPRHRRMRSGASAASNLSPNKGDIDSMK